MLRRELTKSSSRPEKASHRICWYSSSMSNGRRAPLAENDCWTCSLLSSLHCSSTVIDGCGVKYLTMVAAEIKRPSASCPMVFISGLPTKFGSLTCKYLVMSDPTCSIGTSCRRQTALGEKDLQSLTTRGS